MNKKCSKFAWKVDQKMKTRVKTSNWCPKLQFSPKFIKKNLHLHLVSEISIFAPSSKRRPKKRSSLLFSVRFQSPWSNVKVKIKKGSQASLIFVSLFHFKNTPKSSKVASHNVFRKSIKKSIPICYFRPIWQPWS